MIPSFFFVALGKAHPALGIPICQTTRRDRALSESADAKHRIMNGVATYLGAAAVES
jgi:hypothetical protein